MTDLQKNTIIDELSQLSVKIKEQRYSASIAVRNLNFLVNSLRNLAGFNEIEPTVKLISKQWFGYTNYERRKHVDKLVKIIKEVIN